MANDEKDKSRTREAGDEREGSISESPRPRVSESPGSHVSESPHPRAPTSPRRPISPSPSPRVTASPRPHHHRHPALYGVMAEFDNPTDVVAAARRTYEAGYRRINGYSPYPIEELWEAIGFHRTGLPVIVLIGGIIGAVGGFFLQYYLAVLDYPLNVGGKPFNSWPAFIPITFELTILCAAFAAVLGMLGLNKLPQPYHPVFNAPNFDLATRDHFFLVIEANDPLYNHDEVVSFLKGLGAKDVTDVEV